MELEQPAPATAVIYLNGRGMGVPAAYCADRHEPPPARASSALAWFLSTVSKRDHKS